MTTAVHQTIKEITFETWELVSRLTRQDKSKRMPDVKQHIVMSQNIDCDGLEQYESSGRLSDKILT